MRISYVCVNVGIWGSNLILTSYRSFLMIRLCSENVFCSFSFLDRFECVLWSFFAFLYAIFGIVYIQIWERTHISANDTLLSKSFDFRLFISKSCVHLNVAVSICVQSVLFIRIQFWMVRFLQSKYIWTLNTIIITIYWLCLSLYLLRFFITFFSLYSRSFFGILFFSLFFNHLRLGCWVFLLFMVNVCVISLVI